MENKGAAGTLLCRLCQNVVSTASGLREHSSSLVSSLEIDVAKFVLRTSESAQQTALRLQEQESVLGKTAFDKLQTALGFNHAPAGLLLHPSLGPKLLGTVMFDWMHIFLVHGVANTECGLLLGTLSTAGWPTAINDFINSFEWPAQLRGAKPSNVFAKRGCRTKPAKRSASEQLNLIPVLRHIVLFVAEAAEGAVRDACRSFLLLCRVIDLLLLVSRGSAVGHPCCLGTRPLGAQEPLGSAPWHAPASSWYSAFMLCPRAQAQALEEVCEPAVGHIPSSLLLDVLQTQLLNMEDAWDLPLQTACTLVQPRPPPKAKLSALTQLGFQGRWVTSLALMLQDGQRTQAGDVVQAVVDGSLLVCKVQWHAQCDDLLLSCL